jgi:hypothetical protein
VAVKYINIFLSKALQNLPKIGIFGLITNHLATLVLLQLPQWSENLKMRHLIAGRSFLNALGAYLLSLRIMMIPFKGQCKNQPV